MLPNKVYDVLKWVTMVLLPAVGVLYATLAPVWNMPAAEQVGTTIMAVTVFLGALLQLSNAVYNAKKS